MNQKTEQTGEFSGSFIRWLILLTLATVCMFLYLNYDLGRKSWFTLLPWLSAEELSLRQGIEAFSGSMRSGVQQERNLHLLAGLLAGFILGPTLMLSGWRAFKRGKGGIILNSTAFIAGGIVTFSAIILTITPLLHKTQGIDKLKNSKEIEDQSHMLSVDLRRIATKVYEYYILPKDLGGGGHSYDNYNLPPELNSNENGTFQIVGRSQDLIKIKVTSVKFSKASITAELDSEGELRNYQHEGEFE